MYQYLASIHLLNINTMIPLKRELPVLCVHMISLKYEFYSIGLSTVIRCRLKQNKQKIYKTLTIFSSEDARRTSRKRKRPTGLFGRRTTNKQANTNEQAARAPRTATGLTYGKASASALVVMGLTCDL